MIDRIRNLLKRDYKLIGVTATIMTVIFAVVRFVFNRPFVFSNDQILQYEPFYNEWIRLIVDCLKGNGLPFYSWNSFLGADFYSSMIYYCIGDIFTPILLIFKNNIHVGLIIESVICVFVSSLLMKRFLELVEVKSEEALLFIPISYGIINVYMCYLGVFMFMRFMAFLPLLFIGINLYFKNGSRSVFVVSLVILLLQNYYFLWPVAIMIVFYCIKLEFEKKNEPKKELKDFFNILFASLIAVLICAVVLVPSMVSLLNNTRIGESGRADFFWNIKYYLGFALNFSSLNLSGIIDSFYTSVGDGGHGSCYQVLLGIVPFILTCSYVSKKKNRSELLFVLILMLFLFIKPLNSVMHGFSIPTFRWSSIITFYLLILAAKELDEVNVKRAVVCGLSYLLLCLFAVTVCVLLDEADIDVNFEQLLVLYCSILVSFLIVYLMAKKGINASLTANLCFLVCCVLTIIYFQTHYVSYGEESINKYYLQYHVQQDSDLIYRYYFDGSKIYPTTSINRNKSFDYSAMTTQTYNSCIDYSTDEFVKKYSDYNGPDWAVSFSDPYLLTVLGTKYYIVFSENELPEELEFAYSYNVGSMDVYENLNYQGFGYTASYLSDDFSKSTPELLLDTIYVDDDVDLDKYGTLEKKKLNVIEKANNYLISDVELENSNILFIPVPYSDGWKILVNGEPVSAIRVNGGFIGIELEKGYNYIEMYYSPSTLKYGLLASVAGVCLFICILYKERKH